MQQESDIYKILLCTPAYDCSNLHSCNIAYTRQAKPLLQDNIIKPRVFIIYNINLDSIYYIDVYMGRFLQNGQRSYTCY